MWLIFIASNKSVGKTERGPGIFNNNAYEVFITFFSY